VFSLLGLAYYLVEARRLPVGWLVVLTLAHEWLGVKLNSWWWYALANAALLVVLVYVGRLWLQIRSIAARRLQPA
jgi:hypothetical protein